ncbi:MAG: dihydroorotate dehydrogenase electron transfer subunit [Oscillospiraceae bacterium]|jgi:dihydroorotate dehydrogenase electron transfer subunit|nr:dihydroorotate dehydrogenase electron transfer subunit [Oscillospiraceae bacterium]
MKENLFVLRENVPLTGSVWQMDLEGDTSAITAPGQFVNLRLEGKFLRRPISVCDVEGDRLRLVYKVVGEGTRAMSGYEPGKSLDLLTGLGNGYDLAPAGDRPLLVGGGVGVPPLYLLCRRLVQQGRRPHVVLGFPSLEEAFYQREFLDLGATVDLWTQDGSNGQKGLVTDGMKAAGEYTYVYTCGPEPMLKAVWQLSETSGQFSFEERMGCGFGACMGCSCKTKYGSKRICKDGPVLVKEEILW